MAKKKNLPLAFLIAALTGFLFLWSLEIWLEAAIISGKLFSGSYLGNNLTDKIARFGTIETVELLPQLKIRWILICLLAFWLVQMAASVPASEENQLRWRVRLFFVIQLLYIPELLTELSIRRQWSAFFSPPLLPGIILETIPSFALVQFCGLLLFGISAWLILTRWKNGSFLPAAAALTIWLLWTFLLSIYQSGGVTDHAYASMHSAMFFMVIFLLIWWKSPPDAGLGHHLFQAGIWACYFFSGLEKLLLSGTGWFDSGAFSTLCLHHPGKWCSWLAAQPLLAISGMLFVLLFQLLSPLQWRFPRWGYVNVIIGLLFHLGTWLVLDVGGWQSPWIAMLIFLLPPGKETKQ